MKRYIKLYEQNVKNVSGIFYHQTSEQASKSILKYGFIVEENLDQKFSVGIYLSPVVGTQYGDVTIQCKVKGKFIDLTKDKFGDKWKKLKNISSPEGYDNYKELTDNIISLHPDADGILFDAMLVVWNPKRNITNIKRLI